MKNGNLMLVINNEKEIRIFNPASFVYTKLPVNTAGKILKLSKLLPTTWLWAAIS
ncbi:MAG: hypothetical protein HYX40_06220 [Sphingobacteriales bacterium]|nr:hypothetical protein [Sphingobacteriales bacterium]